MYDVSRLLDWSAPALNDTDKKRMNNIQVLERHMTKCTVLLNYRLEHHKSNLDSNTQIEYNIKNPIEGERMRT